MKKRYLLLILIAMLVVAILGGFAVVGSGKGPDQRGSSLADRVLQRDDLPRSEGYYSAEVGVERFPGPKSFVNLPFQVSGTQTAYQAGMWYPLEDGSSAVYVLNVAYQYQNKGQAEAVFRQQVDHGNRLHSDLDLPENASVESVGFSESLARANGVHGQALRITYPAEGLTFELYYFVGAKDNVFVLLMVDGLPSLEAQELFDTLVTTVIQR